MAGHSNKNTQDDAAANAGDKDDATTPAIPEVVLASFLTALTGAITTAVATTVSAVRLVPTPRHSMEIDQFDKKAMDLTLRYGRGQWSKAT